MVLCIYNLCQLQRISFYTHYIDIHYSLICKVQLQSSPLPWEMILLLQEIDMVRVTILSRDKLSMGNIHGYVKKKKETPHYI